MGLNFNLLDYYKSDKANFSVREYQGLYKIVPRHLGIDWEAYQALESRGIVLDNEGTIVQLPFRKFFNYKQFTEDSGHFSDLAPYCDWDFDSDFYVTEKLDGSYVIVSTYLGELIVSSSGSLHGDFAQLFKKWFHTNLSREQIVQLENIGEVYTLMFEYTSPNNKIVIEYKEEAMTLIGARNTHTGKLATREALQLFSKEIGIPLVKTLDVRTFGELIKKVESTKNIEGYVVTFSSGHMLKIKTEEYVTKHWQITPWLFSNKIGVRDIDKIVNHILDSTLDDIMAMPELKGRAILNTMTEALALYEDFLGIREEALSILKAPNFNKKEFYTTEKNRTLRALVGTNINNGNSEAKEEIILRRYIKENIKNRKGEKNY